MAGVFMDELNNSNGNHDDDEVTQRVIPSRLPGPQARTQSVGSRNEDPVPSRLPGPQARTQSVGSRNEDPVPSRPPNNLESQARTQSVREPDSRNEDPTLTWKQKKGDSGAVHVIEREHEPQRGADLVDTGSREATRGR